MQLKRTLRELKIILLKKNLASFRVSRRGDLIDNMDPGLFTELLTEIFEATRITVTVCYGKVELPSPEERRHIIEILHDSLVGGHKGVNQTYRKIRERYYWPGMRNDMSYLTLSNRGTSFLSEIVEGLRLFRIQHLTTSGYHPQTNGSLERSHASLMDFVRSYQEKYDDWDNLAPYAAFIYNTSVHASTNFTTFELVYG